jgi:short-subunit dehydrogenase
MPHILVTGASSGIGEAFAHALAARGKNLVLVARRRERLNALANKLKTSFGVDVIVVATDLAEASGVASVVEATKHGQWQLEGLINNAGFGDRGRFEQLSLERQLNMIQVNVTSLVALTHQLLPFMQNPGGFIINVASTAAFQAGPNMAIYYATKAFVLSFSEALHEELRGHIHVSALCPGATDSEFATEANVANTLLFKAGTMTAEAVVNKALAAYRRAIVITGWKNKLVIWSSKLSPRGLTRKVAGWLQK